MLAVAAGGCGAADPSASAAEPGQAAATAGLPSAAPTTGSADPAPDPTATPSDSATESPRFGETFRYAGGLAVTVGAPEPFRPAPWVEPGRGPPCGSRSRCATGPGTEWKPSQLHVRLLAAFAPATQIFDYDSDVVARPEHRVPHGRSVTFWVGYWVPDTESLAVVFSPGFGYQDITVTDQSR